VEEHFNFLTAAPGDANQIDLTRLVAAMGYDATWSALVGERLVDFDQRIAAMDAAGIDVSLLSHTVPGAQGIADPARAAAAARDINDYLAGQAIAKYPSRFAGLASVAMHDPAVAARELERAVTRIHHAIPDDPVCRRAFTRWMKMDISLDPLRPLPEFQRLMFELEHEFPDERPKAIPLLQSA